MACFHVRRYYGCQGSEWEFICRQVGGGGLDSKQAKKYESCITLGKSGCLVCTVCVWMSELLNMRTTKQERQAGLEVQGLTNFRFQPYP